MNVLRAVRWGIDAWESKVIQNCRARSQAVGFMARPFPANIWSESSEVVQSIQAGVQALQDQGRIQQAMNIR